jgi:hypothetical protein
LKRIWHRYVWEKQTYQQLATHYAVSLPTIKALIDAFKHPDTYPYQELPPQPIYLTIDAFYWGQKEGVLVFKASNLNRCLFWCEIETESRSDYQAGVALLIEMGWTILGITVDGKKGVLTALSAYAPVQLCQFHQLATVTRYLSRRPQLMAGYELKRIALTLTKTTLQDLAFYLNAWYLKHRLFLKEKTYHPSGRWSYTHKRIRSCYFSLQRNLPFLFTFHQHPGMPNTTNCVDGSISHLRTLHRLHRGAKLHRRRKITEEILRGKTT